MRYERISSLFQTTLASDYFTAPLLKSIRGDSLSGDARGSTNVQMNCIGNPMISEYPEHQLGVIEAHLAVLKRDVSIGIRCCRPSSV